MNPLAALFRPFLDERERWFLWLPAFMAGGIALYFALPVEPATAWLVLSPALTVLGFALRRFDRALPLWGAFLALCVGFNAAQAETLWLSTPMLNARMGPTSITGRLIHAEPMPDGASRLLIQRPYIKDLPRENRLNLVRMKLRTPYANLPEPGGRINVWGPLWPPSEPVAPDDYDFRRNAYFKKMGASGISYVQPREREQKYPPRFFWDGFNLLFEKMRRALTLKVLERRPEGDETFMTVALLTGAQSGIGKETMQDMRSSGLSHLLSISGVHVSMFALLVYLPLRFALALVPWIALRFPIKKWAAAAAILSTAIYTLLVGPEAPTVRSALMTSIVMLAIIADRKALSLRLVALAALVIMPLAPHSVIGPSFQMSFAAVLAMIAAYEKRIDAALKEGLSWDLPHWIKSLGRGGRDIILTSMIATAATTPFTLFHFQTFSFYGVAANMIAIPLTSLWVMPHLLLTYLAAPFGGEGIFIDAAAWGVRRIIEIAHTVAAWPHAQIFAPPMPLWAFALFVAGLLWLCLWRSRMRFWGLLPVLIACVYPLTVSLPSVFIAGEDGLWGVRLSDGRLATFGKRAENFTIHQWRQRTLNADALYFTPKHPPEGYNDLSCNATVCRFTVNENVVAFLSKKASDQEAQDACTAAQAIVAPFRTLGDCAAPIVIDAVALSARGAHVLYAEKSGWRVESVRMKGTARPWSLQARGEPP